MVYEGSYGMNDKKRYHGKIDLTARNASHTQMYEFVVDAARPPHARVLEVGCATGFFGEVLKERGYEVWGVEISSEQAAEAERRLDRVYRGDIESFLRSDEARRVRFDVILFGDVLEHLDRPLDTLASCAAILAPEGAIVASVPNVAHLAVRLMLLEGRWEYAPFGILDDTHLRFFTRRSVIDLFTRAGYVVHGMDAVRLPVELTGIQVAPALREAVRPFVTDDDQDVFQHVVMAKKPADGESPEFNSRFVNTRTRNILCLLPFADGYFYPLQQICVRTNSTYKFRLPVLPNTREILCPPKPKEFDRAYLTSCFLAVFGT